MPIRQLENRFFSFRKGVRIPIMIDIPQFPFRYVVSSGPDDIGRLSILTAIQTGHAQPGQLLGLGFDPAVEQQHVELIKLAENIRDIRHELRIDRVTDPVLKHVHGFSNIRFHVFRFYERQNRHSASNCLANRAQSAVTTASAGFGSAQLYSRSTSAFIRWKPMVSEKKQHSSRMSVSLKCLRRVPNISGSRGLGGTNWMKRSASVSTAFSRSLKASEVL